MGAIFVSYRRSDSQGEAGRLFDDLIKHFGEQMVFMDVAAIEAGRDFRKAIEESVAECGVLLVIVGPEWLNAKDETGARRLDDPADFVRIETASALRRDIPVIPVLVRGAEMPRPEQLPEGLKDLAYRNCIELTHARWRSDIQLLIEALRRLVGDTSQIGTRTGPNQAAASARPGILHEEKTGSSKLENGSSTPVDLAAMQRVSRELALHIGPIAEIVVKRAATHCNSVKDLYLKVAEEIDSRDGREEFLLGRASIPSTALPDVAGTTTPPSTTPGSSKTPTLSEGTDVPATGMQRSSRWKYSLLASGGVIFLILVLIVALRIAARRGAGSSPPVQTSPQATHTEESAPVKTSTPPLGMGSSAVGGAPSSAAEGSAGGVNGGRIMSTTAVVPKVATAQRVRVSPDVSAGLLIRKVMPVYPPTARQARVQGAVALRVAISKEGTVESLQETSGHPLLIPAAIDAVKQWRYKPYMINGEPVEVETEVVVAFTLKAE